MNGGVWNHRSCEVCGTYEDNDFEDHKNSSTHKFNYLLLEYNKRRKKNAVDRNGIIVTPTLKGDHNNNNIEVEPHAKPGYLFVKITPEMFETVGKKLHFVYTIRNNSDLSYRVRLTILYPFHAFSINPDNTQYVLASGAECRPEITFRLDTASIGSYKIPMVVTVEPYNEARTDFFNIYKNIEIYLRDRPAEDHVPEYIPFKGDKWEKNIKFTPPLKSPKMTNLYPIAEPLIRIFLYNLSPFKSISVNENVALAEICRILNRGLNMENYGDFFENLLWLDETSAKLGLMNYNMTTVSISLIRGKVLELEVPGLAEKRPSIVHGDLVNLRLQGDHTAYQGVVTNITDSSIYISHVHPEFLSYIEENPMYEVDVTFEFSRLQYERMHHGIHMCVANRMLRSLFPTPYVNPNRNPIRLSRSDLYCKTICGNSFQMHAVENILNNTSQTAPYIVFGPPGTGKTTTIVEAILQLKKHFPKKRILVCAPSNSACDMLCTKLGEYIPNTKELLRIQSMNRASTDIPVEVRKHCNMEGGEMVMIDFKTLKSYNIIVATLHLIGKLTGKYCPDCLFIDEAAQATEPECAIPIGLLEYGAQIILAGDPKQLGPICSSKLAGSKGLQTSLMDRLMETNNLYQPRNRNSSNYDPDYLTMLRLNYRSHKDIIAIPNELFYSNSLECHGLQNDKISNMFISPLVLKNINMFYLKGCAVEFCGVLSKEERKGYSPSYFNESEIQMVVKYIKVLCNNAECLVLESDIGIIAPYIRQVHLIKTRLSNMGFPDVEVGTTENFQGREKRVMIISTVRAQHSLLKYDRKYDLGFVKHERRFNVALTRAQSKLIIIGNPLCLNYDRKCWSKLIQYCEDNNAYFGCANIERTSDIRKIIEGKFSKTKVI